MEEVRDYLENAEVGVGTRSRNVHPDGLANRVSGPLWAPPRWCGPFGRWGGVGPGGHGHRRQPRTREPAEVPLLWFPGRGAFAAPVGAWKGRIPRSRQLRRGLDERLGRRAPPLGPVSSGGSPARAGTSSPGWKTLGDGNCVGYGRRGPPAIVATSVRPLTSTTTVSVGR